MPDNYKVKLHDNRYDAQLGDAYDITSKAEQKHSSSGKMEFDQKEEGKEDAPTLLQEKKGDSWLGKCCPCLTIEYVAPPAPPATLTAPTSCSCACFLPK